jgi:hypothetical protein
MKLLKSNPGIFALILGFAIALTSSAFTAKREMSYWHLKTNIINPDLFSENSYEEVGSAESQGCDNTLVKPCVLSFDTGSYDDLGEYLSSFEEDEQALIQAAEATRSN